MATPRFAWGIDIGNRALKAVKLVPTANGLAIDDFDLIEHETVLSEAGDNRDSLIQTALATFVQRHPGIEKGQIGIGVNGKSAFAKFIKLPPVEARKIPEIVRFEAIQQIPFPLDDVEWTYSLFQDPESPEIEVGIFAMRKELVNQHIKFFTDDNLNVQVVQMNPLAVYNALFYDSRIKGTTMIVDLGAENTDLLIADGESVWLRSIPIGGNNFTEALTKSFKVNFEKAEDLKRNATTSKYGRQIMQAMRPIFADLVSEIQRSIGYYSSVRKESRITRVLALGSTFRLPGLQKYLEQNLTLDVKKLDHLGTGAMEDARVAASLSENVLTAAGAYGLALQVMGQGKIASSLLPEHIRREKMWREKTKWFATAAALFVAGTAVAYGSVYYHGAMMTAQQNLDIANQLDTVQRGAQKQDSDWAKIEQDGTADRQQIRNVLSLDRGHAVWPQINSLLYQSLPQGAADAPAALRSGDPQQLKSVPRASRNQLTIDAIVSHYQPDLGAVLAGAPDLAALADPAVDQTGGTAGGAGGYGNSAFSVAQPAAAAAGTAVPAVKERGYVVTLKCTTPSARGVSLVEQFINTLKAAPATPARPWEVTSAKIARQSLVRDDPVRMKDLVARWQARQKAAVPDPVASPFGRPGAGAAPILPGAGQQSFGLGTNMGSGSGAQPVAIPTEAYFDPVLNEDVRDDTEAVVVLTIVLDPVLAKPKPGDKAVAMASDAVR